MRVRFLAMLAVALIAAAPRVSTAQQFPNGPAALSVPHPLPPPLSTLPVPPRDLYQQITPPPVIVPVVVYPFVYGPPYMSDRRTSSELPSYRRPLYLRLPGSPKAGFDSNLLPAPRRSMWMEFVGLIDDFGLSGRALDLEEGNHRVELRAAGYATLNFDISITANQTTRYRGDLQRLLQPAPAAAVIPVPQAQARTTYVIPNCYAGDRPPSRALPRGCDITQLRVGR